MEDHFRCQCPITSSLDILGDRWTLVIIKQMLFENKSTFKDFTESQESIATNILSSRLKMLETFGIIEKGSRSNNKKTKIYTLTEKGLSLTPVLIELTLWSKDHIQEFHPNLNLASDLESVRKNKEKSYKYIQSTYQNYKHSLFEIRDDE